jgi:DNA-binding CsgD family transcriptional regulator
LAVISGYALFLASEFICLHSPTLFCQLAPASRQRWAPYLICLLVAQALVLALGGTAALRQRACRMAAAAPAAACVCLALTAALALAGAGRLGAQPRPWLVAAVALFYGAGSGLFCLAWSRVFCAISPRRLYRRLIYAYLLGLLIYLVAISLPSAALIPILIAAALISSALLLALREGKRGGGAKATGSQRAERAARAERAERAGQAGQGRQAGQAGQADQADQTGQTGQADQAGQAVQPGAGQPADARAGDGSAPPGPLAQVAQVAQVARPRWTRTLGLCRRGLLVTAALAFMSGLVGQVSAQEQLPLESFQQVSIIASLLVVAILLLSALALRRPLDITAAYRLALPISAGGFLLLPFAPEALPGAASALVHMGYMTVSIPLWYLLALAAAQTRLPVQAVFGGGLAVVGAANLAGIGLAFAAGQRLSQGPLALAAVGLGALYVLSLVSLALIRRPGPTEAEAPGGGARQVVVAEDRGFLASCQALSARSDLTPREAEMLPLLGQGRSVASISKLLFISENTTKSHVRNIYRKLDVHTKQELIELVRGLGQ